MGNDLSNFPQSRRNPVTVRMKLPSIRKSAILQRENSHGLPILIPQAQVLQFPQRPGVLEALQPRPIHEQRTQVREAANVEALESVVAESEDPEFRHRHAGFERLEVVGVCPPSEQNKATFNQTLSAIPGTSARIYMSYLD